MRTSTNASRSAAAGSERLLGLSVLLSLVSHLGVYLVGLIEPLPDAILGGFRLLGLLDFSAAYGCARSGSFCQPTARQCAQ